MFPISISQLKSINLFKLFKLILWYFLRNFQLKNDNTFQSVLIIGDKLESITLKLPKVSKPNNSTLIIFEDFEFKYLFKFFRYVKNMRILDKNYLLTTEASTRFRLNYFDICNTNQKANYRKLSINNYENLSNNFMDNEIALLGTGPSFEKGKQIFKKKKITIMTCNSAIYDDDIWENNHVIFTFADPVFHFGKSQEAQRFKNEVINKFKKYKFYIVVPLPAFPIILEEWGIDKNFVIGINSRDGKLKYPLLDENLTSLRTSNVLTEFMLPFSSTISKKIELAGFDGRKKEEQNFWQYSETTNQTLEGHQKQHPSFFQDRNINNYYKKHLKIFKKQIDLLEQENYVILNNSISNIKFLNKRIYE